MMSTEAKSGQNSNRGFSIIELLTVLTLIGVLSAFAIPQLIAMRRLNRAAAIPMQIKTELRLARQRAMSERQAVTFQYDDQLKVVSFIAHGTSGAAVLTATGYPNTTGSTQVLHAALSGSGVSASEIAYGFPTGVTPAALADSTTMTTLTSGRYVNITFQPDGSVIASSGLPANFALFFYNTGAPTQTATAVSVLGSAGRVKSWRYNTSANSYVE